MSEKMNEKVDIIAVAKAARVSPSTVSRSFNHPGLVSPATRKRITRAVEKLGYIRNRAAQSMHGRRNATIGLIVPTIDHAIFAEVIQSFSDSIDRAGFTLLIASHSYDLDREYAMMRKLMEHRVDGIALVGLEHADASLRLLEQQGTPAMALWNYAPDSLLPCVGADNREAGRIAADHLLELGHRDIGLVFPRPEGNDRASARLWGARERLLAAGIPLIADWQWEAPYSIAQAKQVAQDLLRRAHRPSALLCGNDVIAQGVIYGAQSCGLRVPEDISVIGIGDFKGSSEMEPGLTTIRIPARTIGEIAGERFTDLITGASDDHFRVRCPLECILRGTSRAVHAVGD
ncbi:LacI family DNA-binding transcriptional regulator [uncultured Roseovarius sp.]|uniref:LacI family DNA-binding transcriptional regulator n=1 Tax=uncultured Roseovarius sp. TaxID=293344 RepID=UPI000C4696D5|nr:transcriptional regulator [Roseovarius sp.]MBD12009.1 transcriptional regulator [Roseovarius sp.]